jgi:hypothetical protein
MTLASIGNWVAALAVVAILSLLWRENRLYRVAEHLLLGLTVGFVAAATWAELLRPKWYQPFAEALSTRDPLGIFVGFSALALGCCWYGLYFPKTEWLSRLALGVVLGAAAGQAIKNNFTQQMPLVVTSFRSPIEISAGKVDWLGSLNNSLFLLALVTVLLFFFFSFDQKNPAVKLATRIGRFWLMVGFGVYFGNTVMTRLAVLIERVWFVTQDFVGSFFVRVG